MAAAIAAGRGLRTSGSPLIADVKAYLRPRRLVLLLDNFEQVTAAAPLVGDLLAAAAGLVVLVTSRTVLRLSGEHELPVEPLPTPPVGAAGGLQLADLRQYPAVRLFEERAHAAAPGFRADQRERRGRSRDLPSAGRPAAGYRAGRLPEQAAAAAGAARPAR